MSYAFQDFYIWKIPTHLDVGVLRKYNTKIIIPSYITPSYGACLEDLRGHKIKEGPRL